MEGFEIKNGILKKYTGSDVDVIIPDGIKKIAELAFHGCKNLQKITLPESITHIGNNAFHFCESLQSIEIPASVVRIGKSVFYHCGSLQRIAVAEGNPVYHSQNDCLIDMEKKVLIAGCVNSRIPTDGSVTEIGEYAFAFCERLRKITIPSGITMIGNSAFTHCKELENITIPEGVTHIGDNAFWNCENLQSITVPNSVTNVGSTIFLQQMTLRRCVLAPGSENEEQNQTLWRAFGIRNLAIPFLLDSLETNEWIRKTVQSRITAKKFRDEFMPILIERNESAAISKLLSLVKKMSVDELDDYIRLAQDNPEIRAMLLEYKDNLYSSDDIDKIEEIQMEKEFGFREKTLADYRKEFKISKDGNVYQITGYKSQNEIVRVPGNIKGIPVRVGYIAFSGPGKWHIREVYLENGVTEIGDSAFLQCSHLQSVMIPNTVTAIGNFAFTRCVNLQYVNLPDGITNIGTRAFEYCENLQNVHIPNGLEEIEANVFLRCRNLQSVTIPNSVKRIGVYAFSNCESLRQITIPENVTNIEGFAFSGCTNLQEVTLHGGIKKIGEWLFSGCIHLQNVIIPDGITEIGDWAFGYCENLQSIMIPDSVTEIGTEAFHDCKKLTIYGSEGSYAKKYAEENGIPFQTVSIL